MKIRARMKNGKPIVFDFIDMSDLMPAIDESGNAYEAWTVKIILNGDVCFSQTDKLLTDACGNIDRIRSAEDMSLLDRLGIDIKTLSTIDGLDVRCDDKDIKLSKWVVELKKKLATQR